MGIVFMENEKMKDDVIYRQAAIDDIKEIYEYHDTVTEDRIIDHLKRLPSAEPKIIKCEYCAHRNQYRFPPKYEVKDYCEVHEKVTTLTNFCSWAERRTDE